MSQKVEFIKINRLVFPEKDSSIGVNNKVKRVKVLPQFSDDCKSRAK